MTSHIIKELPDGRSPEAQQRLATFLAEYWQDIGDLLHSIILTVIVWGPGVEQEIPLAKKRIQICNRLKELKHNALLSEEIDANPPLELAQELEGVGLHAFLLKVLKQAQHGDFLVILLGKDVYGVLGEMIAICTRRDVTTKIFVLAPKIYKDTFVLTMATEMVEGGSGVVHWYTDDEIDSCNVLTMAVRRVTQLRLLLAYNLAMREG
jgi:hypothetical protein